MAAGWKPKGNLFGYNPRLSSLNIFGVFARVAGAHIIYTWQLAECIYLLDAPIGLQPSMTAIKTAKFCQDRRIKSAGRLFIGGLCSRSCWLNGSLLGSIPSDSHCSRFVDYKAKKVLAFWGFFGRKYVSVSSSSRKYYMQVLGSWHVLFGVCMDGQTVTNTKRRIAKLICCSFLQQHPYYHSMCLFRYTYF